MLAKISARNRFFPEFWRVKKDNSTKLGPQATVQAKFGWGLRDSQTLGLPLSPALLYARMQFFVCYSSRILVINLSKAAHSVPDYNRKWGCCGKPQPPSPP